MICNNCGSTVNPNERFCGNCGAEVDMATMLVDDDQMNAAENPYTQPEQPTQGLNGQPAQPYQQPQYQPYQQPAQPRYQQPAQPQYQPYQQPVQPPYQQPIPQYGMPRAVDPVENSLSGKALGFGIAGISCGAFGVLIVTAILGLIFGIIAIKSSGELTARGFRSNGRSTTGKVLGIIGLVLSIIWLVYWLFIIIIAIAASA